MMQLNLHFEFSNLSEVNFLNSVYSSFISGKLQDFGPQIGPPHVFLCLFLLNYFSLSPYRTRFRLG